MRRARGSARNLAIVASVIGISAIVGAAGCALFQSELEARGEALYEHYCMHCHGENGRQNEGYNWITMPDPRPKDLSSKSEMSTFTDEEIYHTIFRDMKDTTPEIGDVIGDEEFAVPTMPTFKYTLAEEEIWAIVAYVRTLHGVTLTHDMEARKKELQAQLEKAQQANDQATQALEEAEQRAEELAEQADDEIDDSLYSEQEEALTAAAVELEKAKAALANFTSRPKYAPIPRPDVTMPAQQAKALTELGKRLYRNKYGCNGCHQVGDSGGKVGPPLDRAGFRLNPTWVYRWIKYPQSIKPKTRMPNLGISDSDAKALVAYLGTLRAPRPAQPIQKVSN